MNFDEYYFSVFKKNGANLCFKRQDCAQDSFRYARAKSENFFVEIKSIELLDGVRLDFGEYSGDFSEVFRTMRFHALHFGYCTTGGYKGVFDKSVDFSIAANDIWSCSMEAETGSLGKIHCKTTSLSVDLKNCKKELGRFLRNIDFERLHDRMLCAPLVVQADIRSKMLFNKMHEKQNIDILRLSTLESLIFLDNLSKRAELGDKKDGYLKALGVYLQENCDQELKLKSLSERFGVSVSKLTKDFGNHYKTSIYQFIKNSRMKRAQELFKEGKSITQVANEVGYINVSAFSKNFRQYLTEQNALTMPLGGGGLRNFPL